jgi:hypothetical protein
MEAETQSSRVLQAVARVRDRIAPLIGQLADILGRDALDVVLLVHDRDREHPDALVAVRDLDPAYVVRCLLGCIRRMIEPLPRVRSYPGLNQRRQRTSITRLDVLASSSSSELVALYREDGRLAGELVLEHAESERLARALGLHAARGYTEAEREVLKAGLSREAFDAISLQLERDVAQLCAGKPLGAIGAAIHGLTCARAELRELLDVIDDTCAHLENRAAAH